VFRVLKWLMLAALGATALLGVAAYLWLNTPLALRSPDASLPSPTVDVTLPPGSSINTVARHLVQAGVDVPAWQLAMWFRFSGEGRAIKAGSYEIVPGTTPRGLLLQLVQGEQALRRLTLVEGWNYRQVLGALRQADHLVYDLPADAAQNPAALMKHLDRAETHPEGRFFPDTYTYPKNSTASGLLKQAAQAMDQALEAAWAQRQPGLPLKSAQEALVLASVVEKETGTSADRGPIAGVFINRLRLGMRLQTDPTVIYGLGTAFDGNLRKSDLQTDTPYNTYTRAGLPPTPIAMPGRAALQAATQPANTQALYFVARGDGSSHFSTTLAEHNRAVQRYQLR
jgi:UPF0755 protein